MYSMPPFSAGLETGKDESGKLVVIQPWEKSHLPERAWVEAAIHSAHEVWANSRFVCVTCMFAAACPAEKVHLLPHGVRTDVFTPEGPEFPNSYAKKNALPVTSLAAPLPHVKARTSLLRCYLRARSRSMTMFASS